MTGQFLYAMTKTGKTRHLVNTNGSHRRTMCGRGYVSASEKIPQAKGTCRICIEMYEMYTDQLWEEDKRWIVGEDK